VARSQRRYGPDTVHSPWPRATRATVMPRLMLRNRPALGRSHLRRLLAEGGEEPAEAGAGRLDEWSGVLLRRIERLRALREEVREACLDRLGPSLVLGPSSRAGEHVHRFENVAAEREAVGDPRLMLARSCTERACAARKEKNVSRPRDGLGSGSRRSRCAPRRRRGPAEAVAVTAEVVSRLWSLVATRFTVKGETYDLARCPAVQEPACFMTLEGRSRLYVCRHLP
jgi:hypothetical protein